MSDDKVGKVEYLTAVKVAQVYEISFRAAWGQVEE